MRWPAAIAIVLVVALVAGAWELSGPERAPTEATARYDLIVVGSGPGGVAAAIQAARLGARVLILEPTDHIGGQMTAAGVGTMDEGSPLARQSGIYAEFVRRVDAYDVAHGRSSDTCYFHRGSLCVDPRVGEEILRAMMDAEGNKIDVRTGAEVASVTKDGARVTGVVANGREIAAGIVVDAEPYGDLLALAGAASMIGNATSADPLDPASCIQDITSSAIVKEYPGGVPMDLRFRAAPPGYDPRLARYFATFLAANGSALVGDDRFAGPRHPLSFAAYAAYRGLPDITGPANYDALGSITRTTLDLGNDDPVNGNMSARYLTDPAYRARANTQARMLTLDLLYYIQHDLGMSNWSIANDEGYDTPTNRGQHDPRLAGFEAFEDQMPPTPYIREGRRMIGVATLTGDMIARQASGPTSIAVGYYPMDLHGCAASLDPSMDSAADVSSRGHAFEVPLGIVIARDLDGLLATDNAVSVSRLANGATREQPIAMDIGQAAGALAAIAVREHVQPRAVAASEVQDALVAAHAVVSRT